MSLHTVTPIRTVMNLSHNSCGHNEKPRIYRAIRTFFSENPLKDPDFCQFFPTSPKGIASSLVQVAGSAEVTADSEFHVKSDLEGSYR
jgi:hypothetical protein